MEEQVLIIRKAADTDIDYIKNIFENTITHINSADYNPEQISAWINRGDNDTVWRSRIVNQYFIVIETDSEIRGFASLTIDGYIDLMFVDYNHQHKGLATRLLDSIEAKSLKDNIKDITADVSITAKPFFESRGFRVVKKQQVDIGIILTNYKMIKHLD